MDLAVGAAACITAGAQNKKSNERPLRRFEVPVVITEIFLQFRQCLALGQVIGKLPKIPEPHASVLPVDVTGGTHDIIVLL